MKEWNVFLISFGGILVMLSYLMPNPLLLIASGCLVSFIGLRQLKKSK